MKTHAGMFMHTYSLITRLIILQQIVCLDKRTKKNAYQSLENMERCHFR